jgi:hypothetical protein
LNIVNLMFNRIRILTCLLFFLYLPTISYGFPITFTWDANSPVEEITSYVPYIDGVPSAAVTGTSVSLDIPQGVHVFTVTARNVLGESPKSVAVRIPAPPSAPTNVRVSVVVTVNVP